MNERERAKSINSKPLKMFTVPWAGPGCARAKLIPSLSALERNFRKLKIFFLEIIILFVE